MNVLAVSRDETVEAEGAYAHVPSMLDDVRSGRRTEVDFTTGALVLPRCDYGIVATKSMHTRAAIEATAHAFAGGAVCSVQNGAGNEEIIAEYVAEVIRGTTFPAGNVIEPGHVGWDTKGDTH